jgi:hypothetical protein
MHAIARIRIHGKKSVTDRLPDLQFCTIPMYVSQRICNKNRDGDGDWEASFWPLASARHHSSDGRAEHAPCP